MTSTRWLSCLVLVALGLWASRSLAQLSEEAVGDEKTVTEEYDPNEFTFATRKSPLTDEKKEQLDRAAKFFAWRWTWNSYVNDPKKLAEALRDFEGKYNEWILGKGLNNAADPEAKAFFETKLIDHLAPVFKREFATNRVSTINAAQMLAYVAKSKDDKFSDFLVKKLINNPQQSDAVKLFAIRALKEYLDPGKPSWNVQPEIDRVEALTKYIERRDWPKTDNPAEIEAYRYLRREAIQTLAQTQFPYVIARRDPAHAGKVLVQGQVAATLVRVLAVKPVLDPEPSLSEKCQAAIALCNLKIIGPSKYQPEIGFYATGLFLRDYIKEYRDDWANNIKKDKPATYPWKALSNELHAGLVAHAKTANPNPLGKDLLRKSDDLLRKTMSYSEVKLESTTAYASWINGLRSTKRSRKMKVFQDNDLTIDLGE